jgi:FkbM family methyltransferase
MKGILRSLVRAAFNLLPLGVIKWLVHGGFKAKTLRTYLKPGRELVFISDHPLVKGIRIRIDKRFPIERDFMEFGCYDPHSLKLISQVVGPGFACMDIGANVGTFSLPMARYVSPGGRIIAVEPGPSQLERLKFNIKLNPSLETLIEVHELAFSDHEHVLFWKEESGNPGNAAFNPSDGIRMEMTTLDLFATAHGLQRLDFIKIDVEGMELEVLTGAEQSLESLAPMIYYESWIGKKTLWDEKQESLEKLLRHHGYSLYAYLHDTNSLVEVTFPQFHQNTLAVPRRHHESLRNRFVIDKPTGQ